MKILAVFVLTLTLLPCTSALAQWQWVDKEGRKVFSDRAPGPDILEKDILKRPNLSSNKGAAVNSDARGNASVASDAPENTAAAGGAKTSGVDKDIEAKKKQIADAEAAKLKTEQERALKAKVESCARAKQAKATYESGVRLTRSNASGEREFMDDAARAAETKRIQGVIDSDCS